MTDAHKAPLLPPSHRGTDAYANLIERLSRPEIPGLNGIRAIAVLLVILYHAEVLKQWEGMGGIGVMLFFVLSGFLITWLLLKESAKHGTISLTNFYIRRTLRIFPGFYVFWCAAVLTIAVGGKTLQWGHAWSAFLYVSNYYYGLSTATMDTLDHTWSLALEEQFYLVWPLVFLFAFRRIRVLAGVLVGTIAAIWINRAVQFVGFEVSRRYVYRAFDTRADHILIGCLVAVIIWTGWQRRVWTVLLRWPVLIAALVLMAGSIVMSGRSETYKFAIGYIVEPALLALLMVQGVVLLTGLLDLAPMKYLGRLSYAMYLYHPLVFMTLGHFLELPKALNVAATIALTTVCAAVSFHFVEAPTLALKQRLQSPRSPKTIALVAPLVQEPSI